MADLVATALGLIEAYGLIAIFILLVLDGAMLLPVFPGELALIIAVTTYAPDVEGLVLVIAVTTAAGMIGSLLLYGIMRGGGRRILDKYPKLFMMPPARRERLEERFQKKSGQSLVLFLRILPLTRVLVNIPAGLAKMPVLRFIVLSLIGLVLYHTAFLWFAYEVRDPDSAVGSQADRLQEAYASPAWEYVEANTIVTGLAVLALGILWLVRESKRLSKQHGETGSLIGTLTIAILIWGGIALGTALYVTPDELYRAIGYGGIDIHAVADAARMPTVVFVGVIAGVATLLGLILRRRRLIAIAKQRRKLPEVFPWELEENPDKAVLPPWAIPGEAVATFREVSPEDEKDEGRRP